MKNVDPRFQAILDRENAIKIELDRLKDEKKELLLVLVQARFPWKVYVVGQLSEDRCLCSGDSPTGRCVVDHKDPMNEGMGFDDMSCIFCGDLDDE